MPTMSQRRSSFEAKLAGVHRSAYYAARDADALGYRGALQRLEQIQLLAKELMEDSLSPSPAARSRLQHMRDDVPF